MEPNKIGESRSEEEKERLKQKAEEVKDAIRNRFGEEGGFGPPLDKRDSDQQSEGEQQIASTHVGADDRPKKKKDAA
jgi:hypothetical protein